MKVWPEELDSEKVDGMLQLLYPAILSGLEQDMTDIAIELVASVIQWSERGDYANEIYDFIEQVIASDEMQDKMYRYDEERFRTYQLAILQHQGDQGAVNAFIQKHRSYPAIRRTEIIEALLTGEFEKVVRLCRESEQIDSALPGLVHDWKELRFKAYEELGKVPDMIELAYAFAVKGEETYYGKLKNLVEAESWPGCLKR